MKRFQLRLLVLSRQLLLAVFIFGTAKATPGTEEQLISNFRYDPLQTIIAQEDEVMAGLLYDAVNQKIVWQKNAEKPRPIASLTKMMVTLLTIEDIKSGKHAWDDTVRWSRVYFDGYGRRRKKVLVPVVYSLRDVVKAVMIASDNDCAEQLATYIGDGDLSSSIERMNSRAAELGMTNTRYRNPSGLPGAEASLDNSSTPIDQLRLGLELLKYDEILQITSMGFAQVHDGRSASVLRNHNGLTIDYSGQIDGLKTGYTRRAGYCLVGTTEKCGHRLVSVVLGCNSASTRNEVVRNMFNAYYVSIGLDPIGKFCPIPDYAKREQQKPDSGSGKWIVKRESARQIHSVRSGENLYRIADKYGCTVAQLKAWNKNRIPSNGKVRIGQALVVQTVVTRKEWVPDPVQQPDEQVAVSDPVEVTVPASPLYHTVSPGDTLYSIAKKYGVPSIDQLKSMNNIPEGENIRPGMKIKVKVDG